MKTAIQLQNFKCHEAVSLHFTEGLQLIQGGNYTGKSSLLHGILYALWGPSAVPGGNAVVVKYGADKAEASFSFPVNGDQYLVTRSGNKASLEKNGSAVARSASAVNAYIEDLLGMSRERFLQLRYAQQKQTEALLTLGITKLHAVVEEVSGVEVVSTVITRASTALTECNGGLQALPEVDVTAAEQADRELRARLREMAETREADRFHVERLKTEAAEARLRHEQVAEANQKEQDRGRALAHAEADLATWTQTLDEADARIGAFGPDVQSQLEITHTALEAARDAVAEAEASVRHKAAAQRTVDVLEARSSATRKLVEKSQQALSDAPEFEDPAPLQQALNEAAVTFQRLKSERHRVITALTEGVCSKCLRPYEGYDQAALEAEREQLETQLVAASRAHDAAERNVATVLTNNRLREDIERRLTSDQQTLTQQTADLAQARSELEGLDVQVGQLEGAQQQQRLCQEAHDAVLQAISDLQAAQRIRENAIVQLAAAQEALDKLGGPLVLVDLAPFLDADRQAREAYQKASEALTYKNGVYKGLYGQWEAADRELKAARAAAARRTALIDRQNALGQFVKYLRQNRDRFLADIWEGILAYASVFAATCTDGTISQILRTQSGAFSYVEREIEQPIEAASGAQRSIMGLGVQLALARMLPCPLPVLLLDEPTADLDPAHSLAMTSLLAAESQQVIMISHRDMDSAVAGNVINSGEL